MMHYVRPYSASHNHNSTEDDNPSMNLPGGKCVRCEKDEKELSLLEVPMASADIL